MEEEQTALVVPKDRKGKPGRPTKAEMQAVKDRTKGKVGRPKGDSGRMQEFKERLLATGGTKILDKMIQIALDDKHTGQMAAIKLAMDRMLPVSMFEAKGPGNSMPQITINVSGLNSPSVEAVEDVTDVEIKTYSDTE